MTYAHMHKSFATRWSGFEFCFAPVSASALRALCIVPETQHVRPAAEHLKVLDVCAFPDGADHSDTICPLLDSGLVELSSRLNPTIECCSTCTQIRRVFVLRYRCSRFSFMPASTLTLVCSRRCGFESLIVGFYGGRVSKASSQPLSVTHLVVSIWDRPDEKTLIASVNSLWRSARKSIERLHVRDRRKPTLIHDQAQIEWGKTEEVSFKAKDGTDVHGLLTYPVGYVAGTKVPMLLRIHGGPKGQDSHLLSIEAQWFAAHGYAVLRVNYRGSDGRGSKYQRAIAADWGHHEVEDLEAGVNHVIKMGVADPDRLGVGGWKLVVKQRKLGGNGPIMANALACLGLGVTYLGCVGYPEIDPVFHDFARRAEVKSIAEPGHTDALEFDDGKLLLGKYESLGNVSWENLVARVGRDELQRLFDGAALIGMANWTMLPRMSEIWDRLIDEVLPGGARARRRAGSAPSSSTWPTRRSGPSRTSETRWAI